MSEIVIPGMPDFEFKTAPFRHQRDIFEAIKDLEGFALFWEQGVGKTKPVLDIAAYRYEKGMIDALAVIAPPGVHRNWANDEIPAHLVDRVASSASVLVYKSSAAGTQKAKRAREALLSYEHGLRILCMSYNATLTKTGDAFLDRFLKRYRTLMVVDESQMIKSPGTKTTKRIVAKGKKAVSRIALSGTPITQGAFDVYAQIAFVDADFWKSRELAPYAVFETHFGVWTKGTRLDHQGNEYEYPKLVEYKNKDELAGYLKVIGHRLTKESAGLNLPPKVYKKVYFELTAKQRRVYNELREDFVTELPETGDVVEASDLLVRLTRLQQITCGYVATEAGEPVQRIDETNPRLNLLIETLQQCEGKAIIWSKFTADVDILMDALVAIGRKPVRYDGHVSEDDRERNKWAFQYGDATDFVGKPQSAATGLTLHAAKSVHYYSNSYNGGHRAQSEDRAHRSGLRHSVTYYDYIAEDTIDVDVVNNLRKKFRFAQELLGDTEKEYL